MDLLALLDACEESSDVQPVQTPVVGSSAQHRRRVAVCDVIVPAAAEVVFNDEVAAELEDVAD